MNARQVPEKAVPRKIAVPLNVSDEQLDLIARLIRSRERILA